MNLYNLYKVTNTFPDDSTMEIKDILSFDWSDFKWDGTESDYTLTEDDLARPDLLSYKLYTSTEYQNVLLLLNNIGDIFTTAAETVIKVPNISEIQAYIYSKQK